MTTYVRPLIEQVAFRDAAGDVIDYGNRWTHGPPDDSYSVEEHLERFAPLHTVGAAVIDHLVSTYDVIVEEGPHLADDLTNAPEPHDIMRVVRLTPRADGCAPIVCILTDYPGIRLYAGCFFTGVYPSCGCNACDENWLGAADEFEWQVLAIAAGGLAEEVSEPRRPKWSFDRGRGLVRGMGQTISFRLRTIDGSSEQSGVSRADSVLVMALDAARSTLERLAAVSPDGNWLAWPLR